jgi:germination protein M
MGGKCMPFSNKKKIATTILATSFIISGCGFNFPSDVKEINPPKKVEIVNKAETKKTVKQGNVLRELYLIDSNGFVVPQTVEVKADNSALKQALELLVQGGPVTEFLPDGFRAVLPVDTIIKSVNLQDNGTLVIDFSPEFKNYKKDDELNIMQSIGWTATQFPNVKNVQLRINGIDQKIMPVAKTPIGEGLSRDLGINLMKSDVVDIMNTKPITVYYLAQNGKLSYYVPVTKRVPLDTKDMNLAVIEELVKGPSYSSNLLSDFNSDVELLEAPTSQNGQITLNFNENIFTNAEKKEISKYALNSLVLSLTEQPGVEKVAIMVNGKANILDEDGKSLAKPVIRPSHVNTGKF